MEADLIRVDRVEPFQLLRDFICYKSDLLLCNYLFKNVLVTLALLYVEKVSDYWSGVGPRSSAFTDEALSHIQIWN
jgi:hypothetical protein